MVTESDRRIRAVRGATTVERDEPALILDATREMLATIVERNVLRTEDIVSVLFTVTADLRSEFPARAARELGWTDVPLLCTVEIPVPGALGHCVRALLHADIPRARADIRHVYLRGARVLRPDLLSE